MVLPRIAAPDLRPMGSRRTASGLRTMEPVRVIPPRSPEVPLGVRHPLPAVDRPSGPMVRGRDAELTILGQHLDQLLSGVGTVVLVEGGAGMGKSRLLAEVAAMARRLSIRVGCGTADPADTVVQLSVLMEALFEGPSPILERDSPGRRARFAGAEVLAAAGSRGAARAGSARGALAGLPRRPPMGRQRHVGRAPRPAGPSRDGADWLGHRSSPGSGIAPASERDGVLERHGADEDRPRPT